MRLSSFVLAMAVGCLAAASAGPTAAVPLQGKNITKCLAESCVAQVKACIADKQCEAGIKCMENCPKPPRGCMKKCIQSSLDQAMLEVGLCAEAHGCISSDNGVKDMRVLELVEE